MSRKLLHDLLDDCLIHQVRLPAHIVYSSQLLVSFFEMAGPTELCRKLHQLSHTGYGARLAWILMTDDRLTHGLGLRYWRAKALELLKSDEAALELEA